VLRLLRLGGAAAAEPSRGVARVGYPRGSASRAGLHNAAAREQGRGRQPRAAQVDRAAAARLAAPPRVRVRGVWWGSVVGACTSPFPPPPRGSLPGSGGAAAARGEGSGVQRAPPALAGAGLAKAPPPHAYLSLVGRQSRAAATARDRRGGQRTE